MSVYYKYFLDLWSTKPAKHKHFNLYFAARLAVILVLYMVVDKALTTLTHLPEISYYKPVLFWEFLQKIFLTKYGVLFIPLLLITIFYARHLSFPWSKMIQGNGLRTLIAIVALVLAWTYATYDYNLYYGQSHHLDRLLLLAFMALVVYRPMFVIPFIIVVLTISWQFEFISAYSIAAISLPLRLLQLFVCFFILFVFVGKFNLRDFVLLSCSLVASHYWVSGTGKLSWEWISGDTIAFMLPATYANGWWSILSPEEISYIVDLLMPFNGFLRVFTLVVELGSLFILWHHRTVRFILFGFTVFHLGIFLMSGIFFWLWIVVDLTLFFILFYKQQFLKLKPYSRPEIVVSMLLIVSAPFWCRPTKLAWYDVPASYTYRFEGITNNGTVHYLPPDFFAPYDYDFSVGRFSYLSREPLLNITWGSSMSAELGDELLELDHVNEFFHYENTKGGIRYDSTRTQELEDFIKQYVRNWNKRLTKENIGTTVQAPRLIWTFPQYRLTEPLSAVRISQVTTFFYKHEYHTLRTRPIKEIAIPPFDKR